MKTKMTTNEMAAAISSQGADKSFLVNCIQIHHRNPARKIKGLYKLLKTGHAVRQAQFDMDVLIIDGEQAGWEMLEVAAIGNLTPAEEMGAAR